MDIDRFWDVIESVRSAAAEAGDPLDEELVKQLANGTQQEVLEYAERFDELHDALYRWDVWAAWPRHPASRPRSSVRSRRQAPSRAR
ncbi:DUF4240 domain-containing protein [Streptomyces sp. NPDC057927]